jgi:putative transposase
LLPIQRAIWLYLRFTLSFRDVEDLLVERGIAVSYETVKEGGGTGGNSGGDARNSALMRC